MKKLLLALLAVSLIAGCASKETKEKNVTVEDRSGATAVRTTGNEGAQTQANTQGNVRGNPLTDPGSILSKRSIYYDYDSDAIKEEYRSVIEAHAKYLRDNANARATLQGNTDERGSREYNLALGQRRADAVKRMMTAMGVPDNRLDTTSFGEERPKSDCHDESCWKENRRTDISYQGE